MNLLLIPFLLLFLIGCHESRVGTVQVVQNQELNDNPRVRCEELLKIGDIRTLLMKFHQTTDRFLRLTRGNLTPFRIEQIEKTHAELGRITEQIQEILHPDWTDPSWMVRVKWSWQGAEFAPHFRPTHFAIKGASFGGRAWPIQEESFRIEYPASDEIHLVLNQPMSVLEACQILPSLFLLIELRDESKPRPKTMSYQLTLKRIDGVTP